MADEWHVEWLREGVAKWNKRRKKVSFIPDLSGLRFFDILPPDFRDNPKTSRYFEKIDLSNANLVESDLSSLNFSKAKFRDADLSHANLSKSNFQNADFTRAKLADVSFDDSLLENALFDSSNIVDSSLERANVSGALFIGTNMHSSQNPILASMGARIFSSRSEYSSQNATYVIEDLAREAKRSEQLKRKNKYDVFFGTNRNPIFERGALVDFGHQNTQNLAYGICEVIVPPSHKIGSLGSPMWKRLLSRSGERLRLESLISLNSQLFWAAIKAVASKMKVSERPTMFVHGYNTSFNEAAVRAAQLGFDLGIGQGIGLFSWPSKGTMLGYNADEAACEASKYLLADFIEQFVTESSQRSTNIIAHSMGCRCVLGALEVLSNGRKSALKRVNQVILAAADVDTAIMPNLAKHAVGYCKRTTSYAADRDVALKISGWLHNFPRVGIMPPAYVFNGMDTIAVNDSDLGDLSHGYFSASRTVISDIFSILKHNSPPINRHAIEAVSEGDSQYWRLKN
ncbi:MAG: alpha/beta hydrolase [Rhizobiales bacterium]|nr:alpha/beta hydrolase [Hyphomicrobiales bacterium]